MWKVALLGLFAVARAQVCGNGVIEVGEQCDNNNTVSGDGCSSSCQCEDINPNITVIGWPQRTACQQGDLVTVEFQIGYPSWAYFSGDEWDIECDAGDAEAPATCNSTGYCTCTVSTSYADYTNSWSSWWWSTWSSVPTNAHRFWIKVWIQHGEGCACGCDDFVSTRTYWLSECGWCTDDANCTGDGGCASFACNNETGYCELDESAFDATLSSTCGLQFCVSKQCSGSFRGEEACYSDADCPGGSCVVANCSGGVGDGQPCYHADIDRRRATGADFGDAYLYACYASGGTCVQGSSNGTASVASYPQCDDADPCTADFCQPDLPLNQMCSHQPQSCSSGSESKTGTYVVLFIFLAIVLVLLIAGIAVNTRAVERREPRSRR